MICLYDTYVRYVYEFLQNNWSDVSDILLSVQGIHVTLSHLLEAVCFFGLLFFAFKFIRNRWLTLS